MQNPVIQRIKRRAEVCQSLPVTCGRRGNDTGNGMVTVVSLQCAVDCFLKNGKSSHSKPVTFLLLPAAKCRSGMFFTLRPPHVRGDDARPRNRYLYGQQATRTSGAIDHADLRKGARQEQAGSGRQDTRHILTKKGIGFDAFFYCWNIMPRPVRSHVADMPQSRTSGTSHPTSK